MDEKELIETTPGLIESFLPRIPNEYHAGFDHELAGGEHGMAVEHLAEVIDECKVLVTTDERERLRELLHYLQYEDAGIVDAFTVQSPSPHDDA